MQKINIVIAAIALMVLSACSGSTGMEMQREASLINPNTVDAWNTNAAAHNFGPAVENKTLGDLYFGSDFANDMEGMEESIANYLGLNRDDVQGESTMGFVHFDEEMYD